MHYKTFILFLIFTIATTKIFSQTKQYEKELKIFMPFVRDSVFKKQDTLIALDNLCNKGLFSGAALYGVEVLTDKDKHILMGEMHQDTSKYQLTNKIMRRTMLINSPTDSNYYVLSKPIFLRNYKYCAFSFKNVSGEWQMTYLYKKENGKWVTITKLGGSYTW